MKRNESLNTATVVQTAADLANTAGIEALTLHGLARQLGIRTPSLYNHIDGLPGLYRELALLNAQRLETCLVTAVLGKSGPEAVLALAQAYRAFIKANAGLYMVTLRASLNQEKPDQELRAAEDRLVAIVTAVLVPFSLERDDALHAIRGLRSLVHGFATLEIAGGFGLPLDCDESFRRLFDMFLFGLGRTVNAGK